jgi:hypothetical protein
LFSLVPWSGAFKLSCSNIFWITLTLFVTVVRLLLVSNFYIQHAVYLYFKGCDFCLEKSSISCNCNMYYQTFPFDFIKNCDGRFMVTDGSVSVYLVIAFHDYIYIMVISRLVTTHVDTCLYQHFFLYWYYYYCCFYHHHHHHHHHLQKHLYLWKKFTSLKKFYTNGWHVYINLSIHFSKFDLLLLYFLHINFP